MTAVVRGVLVKLSNAAAAGVATVAMTEGLSGVRLRLLDPSIHPDISVQVSAKAEPTWALAEPTDDARREEWARMDPWDVAHLVLDQGLGPAASIEEVEPDLEHRLPLREGTPVTDATCVPAPQDGDPLVKGPSFAWHMGDSHSGLAHALSKIIQETPPTTIVHLDTGFDSNHRANPLNLDLDRQRNFVEEDYPQDASDRTPTSGMLMYRGHGPSTLSVLAGGRLEGMLPPEVNNGAFLGGAPLERIVPVRVANSVVQFWTSTVAQGLLYARDIRADVVSMSLGGLPSSAWADAVNACYESGVVVVAAAGTNYAGWPTSDTVWPARFRRVVAVTGAMADNRAYTGLPASFLQSNFGPTSKLPTTIAAFAPNIARAVLGCVNVISQDGGGTSHAAPQVAAAAALWLRKHKSAAQRIFSEPWMIAEATRQALFRSAQRPARDLHPFFGHGLLRAGEALDIPPLEAARLTKPMPDKIEFGWLGALIECFAEVEPRASRLLKTEMVAASYRSPAAKAILPDPEANNQTLTSQGARAYAKALLNDVQCSRALTNFLSRAANEV